ncbi:MAG TPA: hypothetical protein VNQ76_09215, partial [Planctomicrobium sp.]|nr:hypothetical protein [Planctomicrobium sp.]
MIILNPFPDWRRPRNRSSSNTPDLSLIIRNGISADWSIINQNPVPVEMISQSGSGRFLPDFLRIRIAKVVPVLSVERFFWSVFPSKEPNLPEVIRGEIAAEEFSTNFVRFTAIRLSDRQQPRLLANRSVL